MSLYIALPLVAVFMNATLLALAVLRRQSGPGLRPFTGLLAGMGLWALAILAMRSSPVSGQALAWERVAFAIFPLISILFLHFALRFTDSRVPGRFIPFAYALALALSIIGPTSLVLRGMGEIPFGFGPVPGPFFLPWMQLMGLAVIAGFVLLARFLRSTRSRDERDMALYVLLGVGCGWLGAGTDYLASVKLLPYSGGIVGNILFAALVAVPLVRSGLPYLRSVARRARAHGLAVGLLAGVYVIAAYFYLSRMPPGWQHLIFDLALIGVLALAFRPLVGLSQSLVDRLFYRDRRERLNALRRFAGDMGDIKSISALSSNLAGLVGRAMGTGGAWLFPYRPETGTWGPALGSGPDEAPLCGPESPFHEFLEESGRIIEREALDTRGLGWDLDRDIHERLEEMDAGLLLPLRVCNRLTGLLVVPRKGTGALYDAEEREVLVAVAEGAAFYLENLRLDDLEGRRGVQLEGMEGAKADFIRGVAHRMITPLTVIKASTSMLAEVLGRRVSGERAELLSRIGSGIAQLEKQASELLELFRIRAAAIELSPEPVEVNGLVAETCDNLTLEFRARGQTVELRLLRHSLRALLDRQRFGEVLGGLLSNAGRFAPEGGHIEVRVSIEESGLVVGVSDNGPGVPGEDRDRIFDPFYRAGRPGERAGVGLELARARALAELQGGGIRVENDADEGASFLFALPLRGVPGDTEGKTPPG